MPLSTKLPIAESAVTGSATARADIVTRLRDPSISPGPFNFAMRDEAADTIVALRARVAELGRDAGRLDWVDAQWRDGIHIEVCSVGNGTTWHGLHRKASVYIRGMDFVGGDETIRAAIDAASQPIALQQFADPVPGV